MRRYIPSSLAALSLITGASHVKVAMMKKRGIWKKPSGKPKR